MPRIRNGCSLRRFRLPSAWRLTSIRRQAPCTDWTPAPIDEARIADLCARAQQRPPSASWLATRAANRRRRQVDLPACLFVDWLVIPVHDSRYGRCLRVTSTFRASLVTSVTNNERLGQLADTGVAFVLR